MWAPIQSVIYFLYKLDFTKNINHFLESGKYYLRIEVHWLHQEILK